MKKSRGIIWGIVVMIVGALWILKEANVFDFSRLFAGWWTLFIIVPSLIGLCTDRNKTGSLIFLLIGVTLLVNQYYDIWRYSNYIVPAFVVVAGLIILVNTLVGGKSKDDSFNYNSADTKPAQTPEANQDYFASFSGQNYEFTNGFAGGRFNATFGGIKLDIRNADIVPNCVITTNATFGGVDVYVPNDVRVIVKSNNIFGGVSDKSNKNLPADAKTIFINTTNLFGGTDIK